MHNETHSFSCVCLKRRCSHRRFLLLLAVVFSIFFPFSLSLFRSFSQLRHRTKKRSNRGWTNPSIGSQVTHFHARNFVRRSEWKMIIAETKFQGERERERWFSCRGNKGIEFIGGELIPHKLRQLVGFLRTNGSFSFHLCAPLETRPTLNSFSLSLSLSGSPSVSPSSFHFLPRFSLGSRGHTVVISLHEIKGER